MLGSETFVEPYMGANDDLYERMIINYKEELTNNIKLWKLKTLLLFQRLDFP